MTKPNLLQVIKSVVSAMIGVQSEKNRQHDFSHGSLPTYIAVGLAATILFIFVIAKIAASVAGP
jgi:Protein of unknown function (DUF2970)